MKIRSINLIRSVRDFLVYDQAIVFQKRDDSLNFMNTTISEHSEDFFVLNDTIIYNSKGYCYCCNSSGNINLVGRLNVIKTTDDKYAFFSDYDLSNFSNKKNNLYMTNNSLEEMLLIKEDYNWDTIYSAENIVIIYDKNELEIVKVDNKASIILDRKIYKLSHDIVKVLGTYKDALVLWTSNRNIVLFSEKINSTIYPFDSENNTQNISLNSPILYNEKIVFFEREYLIEIDLKTGKIEWKWREKDHNISGSVIVDNYIYFLDSSDFFPNAFGIFDTDTNEIIHWQKVDLPEFGMLNKPPVINGNKLYLRDDSWNLYVYQRED